MSYDVYLEIDTGGAEPAALGDSLNYTYNCGPMFRLALGRDGINSLEGELAGTAIQTLRSGIAEMEDEPGKYKALNPENGWGSYEGALQFLRDILTACVRHPKATIRVC